MGKRAPIGEEPFRPLLDLNVLNEVLEETVKPPPPVASVPLANEIPKKESRVETNPPFRHEVTRLRETVHPVTAPVREVRREARGSSAVVEKFDQEKRVLLTRSEAASLDRMVNSLATRLDTQVKLSHVFRSLILLLLNAENEIDQRAGEIPPLNRPPNGDPIALQRFEREIARLIGSALRDAGPVK